MARLAATHLFGLVLRLLLVAGCVLPLAGAATATASAVLAAPAGPVNEEEDEAPRDEEAKKAEADPRADRRPVRLPALLGRLPFTASPRSGHPSTALARPTAADPFRNGLGSPFRC